MNTPLTTNNPTTIDDFIGDDPIGDEPGRTRARRLGVRSLVASTAVAALLLGACGSDGESADAEQSEGAHGHHEETLVEVDWDPAPTISLEIVENASGGFDAVAAITDFTLSEDAVDGEPEDGVGHMHLYYDGDKQGRRYDETFALTNLGEGEHEVTLTLSANDHSILALDGERLEATATVEVSAEQAEAMVDEDAMSAAEHGDGHGDHGHEGTGEQTDAPADVEFEISVEGSDRTAGEANIEASVGEVVAITVNSDVADKVHLHGYDILSAVEAGGSTTITFEANIPGKFEVELEDTGFLVTELTVA